MVLGRDHCLAPCYPESVPVPGSIGLASREIGKNAEPQACRGLLNPYLHFNKIPRGLRCAGKCEVQRLLTSDRGLEWGKETCHLHLHSPLTKLEPLLPLWMYIAGHRSTRSTWALSPAEIVGLSLTHHSYFPYLEIACVVPRLQSDNKDKI